MHRTEATKPALIELLLDADPQAVLVRMSEAGLIGPAQLPRWREVFAELRGAEDRLPLRSRLQLALEAANEAQGGELSERKTVQMVLRLRHISACIGESMLNQTLLGRSALDFGAGRYSLFAMPLVLLANGFQRVAMMEGAPLDVDACVASARHAVWWLHSRPEAFRLTPQASAPEMRSRLLAADLSGLRRKLEAFNAGQRRVELGALTLVSNLAELPDRSVDWCYSNSVLEHIEDLGQVLAQLRRLTTDDGQMIHTVDFADHDGYADGQVTRMYYSGVPAKHTNGLRPSQLEGLFRDAGFAGGKLNFMRFPPALLERQRLAGRYRGFDDDDLSEWVNAYYLVKVPTSASRVEPMSAPA